MLYVLCAILLPANPDTIKILLQIRAGSDTLAISTKSEINYAQNKVFPFAGQFFTCALAMEEQLKSNAKFKGKAVVWYLMTDSPPVKEYAKKHYGDKVFGKLEVTTVACYAVSAVST
jgi:hypothetical protein